LEFSGSVVRLDMQREALHVGDAALGAGGLLSSVVSAAA
jgi:hypothetical protein